MASSSAVVRRRRGTRQATGWRASLLAAGRRASPLAARVIVGGCVLPQSCIHQKAVAPSRPQSKRALGEPGVGWGAGRLMPAGLPKTAVIRRSAKTSAARIQCSHRTTAARSKRRQQKARSTSLSTGEHPWNGHIRALPCATPPGGDGHHHHHQPYQT